MNWPLVPLSEALQEVSRPVSLDPTSTYRMLGVRLDSGGPFLRETIPGSAIAAKTAYRVAEGDFIYSRLFAWRGAFGVISSNLDGCTVSNEFPTYRPRENALVEFIALWFRLPATLREVEALCSGSTPLTRNRLREEPFATLRIPLPTVEEQRRIVACVDAIASRVAEGRRLRDEAVLEGQRLCRALLRDASAGEPIPTPMRELVRQRASDVTVERDKDYHFAGVYCFGRGVFRGQRKKGLEFAYDRLTTLHTGDFVYPKLMAWEGALAVVPPECNGLVVSTEFPVFEIDTKRVLPETLDVYFRDPEVWPQLSGHSTGTNVRRQRLNPADFLKHHFPLPPRPVQERLRQVVAVLNATAPVQSATAAELDALLPSVLNQAFAGKL